MTEAPWCYSVGASVIASRISSGESNNLSHVGMFLYLGAHVELFDALVVELDHGRGTLLLFRGCLYPGKPCRGRGIECPARC